MWAHGWMDLLWLGLSALVAGFAFDCGRRIAQRILG
jgi:hypothetical protein